MRRNSLMQMEGSQFDAFQRQNSNRNGSFIAEDVMRNQSFISSASNRPVFVDNYDDVMRQQSFQSQGQQYGGEPDKGNNLSNRSIEIEGMDENMTSPNLSKEDKQITEKEKKGPIPFLLSPPVVEKVSVETQTKIEQTTKDCQTDARKKYAQETQTTVKKYNTQDSQTMTEMNDQDCQTESKLGQEISIQTDALPTRIGISQT